MTTITEGMKLEAARKYASLLGVNYDKALSHDQHKFLLHAEKILTAALSKLPPAPDRDDYSLSIIERESLEYMRADFLGGHVVKASDAQVIVRLVDRLIRLGSPPDRNAVIEECAKICAASVDGLTLHTFNLGGTIAKTVDGDTEFLTRRDVNNLIIKKTAAIRALKTDNVKP